MASSRSKAYAQRRRQAQKRRQQQDSFQLETLEPRVLLAGDTSVDVTQVVSVVPQPITRSGGSLIQAQNQVDVYFNDVDLIDSSTSAENPALYQLIYTSDTITNTDDTIIRPVAVNYSPAANKAVLTFANNLSDLGGDAAFRLRINTQESLPTQPQQVLESVITVSPDAGDDVTRDAGSSFATAASITGTEVAGDRLSGAVTIAGTIEPKEYLLSFPGSGLEPGMRDLPSQPHYLVDSADAPGIAAIPYNFRENYGQVNGVQLKNAITENQKSRAREAFEVYSSELGVTFYETTDQGITVATGDVRALGGQGVLSLAGFAEPEGEAPTVLFNLTAGWSDAAGGSYYKAALREIGRIIGIGVTPEAAGSTVTGNIGESILGPGFDGADTLLPTTQFGVEVEQILPGDASLILGQHLFRPEGIDIDLYRFQVSGGGRFSAEAIAERLPNSSFLDPALALYKRVGTGYELISRNDDYAGEDSYMELDLDSGTYIIGVSASGNTNYDPIVEDNGLNGTSEGDYQIRLDFRPRATQNLLNRSGEALDGDGDGEAGGVFNFWFEANNAERTVYVDKSASSGGTGTLASPYRRIDVALNAAETDSTKDIVRIVGNGGADGDMSTLGDNFAYELGFDDFAQLEDGGALVVPKDVTVMVDEGAIFKMRRSYVQVGSTTTSIDQSGAAFQILGTPNAEVIFTSRSDETIGVDTQVLPTTPNSGDWGGIIYQNDLDRDNNPRNTDGTPRDFEARGIFINHVSNADLRYGGGSVTIDSVQRTVNPIHLIDARPTIAYNDISFSADAAISANPDSFEESRFHAVDSLGFDYQIVPFTSDYDRVGPDVRGNALANNTTNALSVRIDTLAGNPLERLTVAGRFDDTDIVHVIKEDLIIQSTPGGAFERADGTRIGRPDAQLVIDPGMIVKLSGARIEVTLGSQLIAEGGSDAADQVIFTSINDDRFGGITEPAEDAVDAVAGPGDWGGIYVGQQASLSIDHAVIAYGGGVTRIPGTSAAFNAIELHQARAARITNSVLEDNASGLGGIDGAGDRAGRGTHTAAAIFVRGSQPVLIGNTITGTVGTRAGAISIDPNSLNSKQLPDYGTSRGLIERFELFDDNQGPLIQDNILDGNSVNGMIVRPGVMSTAGVWDDTDVVHAVYGQIIVPNQFSNGGLRLESTSSESLVVKLDGETAGFTATGIPLEIDDRVGGSVNLVGQPGRPVIFTSLADDEVGAGLKLDGTTQTNTDEGHFTRPQRTEEVGSFQIDLNLGPELRAQPDIVEGLERAARMWERLIEDPITVTIDFDLDTWALSDNTDRAPGTFEIPGEFDAVGGVAYIAELQQVDVLYDSVVGALKGDARDHEAFVSQIPSFDELNVSLPNTPENPFSLSTEMRLTTANYKAIFGQDLPADALVASTIDVSEAKDGRILINEGVLSFNVGSVPSFYDYDRSDGLAPSKLDFVGTMTEAIGRVLGFDSSIEEVRFALSDATQPREIAITPMDLFRLEPGEGQANFEDAARALDPLQQSHVFYDGGVFDPADLPSQFRFRQGDIPLLADDLDNAFINVEGAIRTSYEHPTNMNEVYLGLGQAESAVGTEFFITDQDRSVFDLIGYDVIGGAVAGDWEGISFQTFSHDRNVGIVTEFEDVNDRDGSNQVPSQAEVLGAIAKSQADADENRRIGFEVHGYINNPADVDVYSFDAQPGTELWIDIDRTSTALDTIVELVDANGLTLARSDNTLDELLGIQDRFETPLAPTFDLNKSPFLSLDNYSTNPRDAGMRVLIPGNSTALSTFFVRVRSAGPNPNILSGGLTEGRYELQLRTQELDEVPGSSVQYADVRYAVDGIRVSGLPRQSPLTGEIQEDETANDTFELSPAGDDFKRYGYTPLRLDRILAGQEQDQYRNLSFLNGFEGPQFVGNVVGSDGAAIAISGELAIPIGEPELLGISSFQGQTDIDYYLFNVDFTAIQQTGVIGSPVVANLMFDLDYADGLGRADTSLYVYKASFPTSITGQFDAYIGDNGIQGGDVQSGALVAYSNSGNDKDDLPAPLSGTDLDDLSRGSVGTEDPILGPIALPEGSYILAVAPGSVVIPQASNQFDVKLPLNPGQRIEPLRSVTRIADQSFDFPPLNEPEIPVLIDENGFVPLTLADVPLFVSTVDNGGGSQIFTVDTFQGGIETEVGILNRVADEDGNNEGGPATLVVGDIVLAERNAPRISPDYLDIQEYLFGFTISDNDANSGNYLPISPEDATIAPLIVLGEDGDLDETLDGNGDDQIQTYRLTEDEVEPGEPRPVEIVPEAGEGVQFQALALLGSGRANRGFATGERGDPATPNILYQFDHRTGRAIGEVREDDVIAPDDETLDEINAFTDVTERGVLFTNEDRRAGSLDAIPNADTSMIVSAVTGLDGQTLIQDADTFEVRTGDEVQVFEFEITDDFQVQADPANGVFLTDGFQFEAGDLTYEIETGAVISIDDVTQIADGDTLAIGDIRNNAPTLFLELDTDGTVGGGRVAVDITDLATEAEIAARVAEVINAQTTFSAAATAQDGRISLVYDGGAIGGSAGLSVVGGDGVTDNAVIPVFVEEFATSSELASALGNTVPGSIVVGSRISFAEAVVDLDDNDVIVSLNGVQGVADDNVAISVSIDFDRQQVADAIADAIGRDATAFDGVVTVRQGRDLTFGNPQGTSFSIRGQSPGGTITGMAFVGTRLLAVSDGGGLYEINGYQDDLGASADYLEQSAGLRGISFSGLTLGPQDVANGEFADTLFATDTGGNLYAFSTDGILQPVFANGATSISTGVAGANGLAFSSSQSNLWHITPERGGDAGHGGGASLRFGDPERSIDLPGGAQGTVVSNEIDLSNYTAEDLPALYFNYFMTAEEVEDVKRDAFRVFIADDSEAAVSKGSWHLLATSDESFRPFDNDPEDDINVDVQTLYNNSYQDVPSLVREGNNIQLTPNDPDVYVPANGERDAFPPVDREDDNPPPFPPDQAEIGEPADWFAFPELDERQGVWRQARIDLSPFVGKESLRLRFDFSTAASFDVGNLGGVELKAVDGSLLSDGDTITIDGTTFEVDLGTTILLPAGASISEGEAIELLDLAGELHRFEFTSDEFVGTESIPVAFSATSTSEEVMLNLVTAINASGFGTATLTLGRIAIEGFETAFTDSGSGIIVQGGGLGVGVASGNVPLALRSTMTAEEVATSLAQSFAVEFGQGIQANYVTTGNIVKLYGNDVSDTGPFGIATELRGDEWGAFYDATRGQNNEFRYYDIDEDGEIVETVLPFGIPGEDDEEFPQDFAVKFEGVYVDDIIIGFRSRGEIANDLRTPHLFSFGYDAVGDFDDTPRIPNVFEYYPQATVIDPFYPGLTTGEYRVEIRTTTQADVQLNQLDRTVPNVTLLASPGTQLFDGKTFQINDGENTVTFEYNDLSLGNGVSDPTHVAINFNVSDSPAQVAVTIRDAFNAIRLLDETDPQRLNLVAISGDGSITTGEVTTESNRVSLIGPALAIESEAPNGIDFINLGFDGSGNRKRGQGQIIITQSQVSNSEGHGIIVEDALRDLPSHLFYDPLDQEQHAQFSTGDYTPHQGPVQNLLALNDENLATGVVISNNIVAFNGEGGIRFGGDPNGYIFTAPFGGSGPGNLEVWDGLKFSVTDNNGLTRTFEFHDLTQSGGPAGPRRPGRPDAVFDGDWEYGNIPILYSRSDFVNAPTECVWAGILGGCEPRYSPIEVDMADRLQEAFERSDLDVTVFRGKGHELFVEGVNEMLWRPRDGRNPGVFANLFSFARPATIGAVPFGRIVNNTVVGLGGEFTDARTEQVIAFAGPEAGNTVTRVINDYKDVGIEVSDNADPTLLNNVIVNFETGLLSDFTTIDTVRQGMVFQANNLTTFNTNPGDFAELLSNSDPLFVDVLNGNFYPAAGSQIIDSSVDSLQERPSLETVKAAVGIAPSPILVPTRDALGQLREDDPAVEPQNGQGRNAFKDRGAIDRVDFAGPTVRLRTPRDNDALGLDQDPTDTVVALSPLVDLDTFEIEFTDTSQLGGLTDGTGVDPLTVSGVSVLQDGSPLQEGTDYILNYDRTNGVLRIIPTSGQWPAGRTYTISLDGVRDLAGNAVRDNQIAGGVNFTVTTQLGTDFGDAPAVYGSASHSISADLFLGSTVTADAGDQADSAASADGGDDGVILPDEFLRSTPNTITVQASTDGTLDGWFDFNGNDTFDASERVIAGVNLLAGANELDISLPQASAGGELFARFRFTADGVDSPTGLVSGGEVEDYVISVESGAIWQNVSNPFDVNDDGFVSPADVLTLRREVSDAVVSNPRTGELDDPFIAPNNPSTIGFVDVDGDGFVTARDVLTVITAVNDARGNGEPAELAAIAAASTSSLTVDPIGEIMENPVVELPTAVPMGPAPAPAILDDILAEDDDELALELAQTQDANAADDLFANLDWFDDDSNS